MHRAGLCLLALALGACNAPDVVIFEDGTAGIVVIENYSPGVVMAARYWSGDETDADPVDVVVVPVGARVSLDVVAAADAQLQHVLLMDGDCAIFAMEPISIDDSSDSTLITVDPDLLVRVRNVENLDPGSQPAATETCQDVAQGVEFQQ
jgi:hypothetical protein